MFEAVEPAQSLSKEDYKNQERNVRTRLLEVQKKLHDSGVALLIIINSVDSAGKGEVVNTLNKWFDSRNIATHAFWDETDEELQRPLNWRYWKRLPARGEISIMFSGWYQTPLYQHAANSISEAELDAYTRKISGIEKMLHVDGMLIVKLWLHLSTDEYKRRQSKQIQFDAKPVHKHRNIKYKNLLNTAERMIRHTDNADCSWQLIASDDANFRDISVASALLKKIEQRLNSRYLLEKCATPDGMPEAVTPDQLTILDHIDTPVSIDKKDAKIAIKYFQNKLIDLSWQAYAARRSVVIVFEGWDAAGKGGAIRRLRSSIDARLCNVISIAAPTDEEMAHHYLWRFWRRIPRDGYITIYDRSWYGRVLVERIEGFAKNDEWMRAYREINDFEEELHDHGAIVIKFWMHISKEEQLKRFKQREKIEWKKHKITEEDWRNREKWDDYWQAVNDMVEHTSTADAPWNIIPANDKAYARLEVLKQTCHILEVALNKH